MASGVDSRAVVPSPTSPSFNKVHEEHARRKDSLCRMKAQRKEKLDKLAHGIAAALTPKRRRSTGPADESHNSTVTKPRRPCSRLHKRRSSSSDDCASVDSGTTLVEIMHRPSTETLVEEPEPIPEPEPEPQLALEPQSPARKQPAEISNSTLALFAALLAVSQVSLCVLAHLKSAGLH